MRFELGPDAYVEYVPDPIIPQAGSRLVQETVVELGQRAVFIAAETLAPGRRARGERFAYERIRLRTQVHRDARELCVDTLELDPARRSPTVRGLFGARDYLVSLLVLCPERDASRLADVLDAGIAGRPGATGAAGELPNGSGAVVRILTDSAMAARRALHHVWRIARGEMLDLALPALRK
jgi:urease accessory protein